MRRKIFLQRRWALEEAMGGVRLSFFLRVRSAKQIMRNDDALSWYLISLAAHSDAGKMLLDYINVNQALSRFIFTRRSFLLKYYGNLHAG
jgi:hypothetical protein